jgi:prepilin signal peptidase PulO-like enzyme (type II secretory pathway)
MATEPQLISALAALLLAVLPLFTPVRAHLIRMLKKGWPNSALHRRQGPLSILDAAVIGVLVVTLTTILDPRPLTFGLGLVLLALTLFDLRYRWLPDRLTLPLSAIGLLTGILICPNPWLPLIGLIGGGGAAWLLAEGFYRLRGVEGLGGGDVKLIAAIGVWSGPEMTPFIIAVAALSALAFEIPAQLIAHGQLNPQRRIPFGAYLAISFFAAWVAGHTLK